MTSVATARGMSRMLDIVCLSKHPWAGPRFRKQHFMMHLQSSGHRVLYLEPSISLTRMLSAEREGRPPWFGYNTRQAPEGVCVVSPAASLPWPGTRPSLYMNHLRLSLLMRRACYRFGISNPVLWVYDPNYAPFIDMFRPAGVVFDLVDDLAGYPYSKPAQMAVERNIGILSNRADRFIVTSEVLANQYAPSVPTKIIANGYDSDLFQSIDGVFGRGKRRRRAAFIGTLFTFVDFSLMRVVAKSLPSFEFLIAGRIYSNDPDLLALLDMPNVKYLGCLSPTEVPSLIASVDVCLAPFKIDRVSRAVSPLKIYEYLAMRKPVVSTPMLGMESDPVGRYIDFASDSQSFVDLVQERALNGRDFGPGFDEVINSATWKNRCQQMEEFVRPIVEQERH